MRRVYAQSKAESQQAEEEGLALRNRVRSAGGKRAEQGELAFPIGFRRAACKPGVRENQLGPLL
jgi:hypothetical protein